LEIEWLHKPRVGGSIPPAAILLRRCHSLATTIKRLQFQVTGGRERAAEKTYTGQYANGMYIAQIPIKRVDFFFLFLG
jgi:hypothetical protein